MDRDAGREGVDLRDIRRRIADQVGFVEHDDGSGAAVQRNQQISFDSAQVVVAIESGHEEYDVDIRRDDLFFRSISGGAARKAARARQHRSDPCHASYAVRAVVLRWLDDYPVTHGWEIRSRRRLMPHST